MLAWTDSESASKLANKVKGQNGLGRVILNLTMNPDKGPVKETLKRGKELLRIMWQRK